MPRRAGRGSQGEGTGPAPDRRSPWAGGDGRKRVILGGGGGRDMADVLLEEGQKAVVIPDVHNKWKRAEAIVAAESPDRVVFLGDYFDDFGDTPEAAGATAEWLAASLADASRVHLAGNHDLNYMSRLPGLHCVGRNHLKASAIARRGVEWSRLEPFCWLGDAGGSDGSWLCTHAGLSAAFLESIRPGAGAADVAGVLGAARADLDRIDDAGHRHPFLQAGRARGGWDVSGGIVWCDYVEEYADVPGLRQIFGHTRGGAVRHGRTAGGGEHYCIDTVLRHYIAYKDGEVSVRAVDGLGIE